MSVELARSKEDLVNTLAGPLYDWLEANDMLGLQGRFSSWPLYALVRLAGSLTPLRNSQPATSESQIGTSEPPNCPRCLCTMELVFVGVRSSDERYMWGCSCVNARRSS